jgi:hypothetical protein
VNDAAGAAAQRHTILHRPTMPRHLRQIRYLYFLMPNLSCSDPPFPCMSDLFLNWFRDNISSARIDSDTICAVSTTY